MKVVYRKGWVKIQQIYENLEFDLDLKLLFMVTEAYYESGLFRSCAVRLHFHHRKPILCVFHRLPVISWC